MSKSVEFFFDVGSPTAYLAWTQLPALCEKAGATLVYRPTLLGGVFQATGNASPANVAAKGRYMNDDMARYAKRYGVPLVVNPHFPINTLTLMRGAAGVQLRMPARFDDYLRGVFKAMWVDGLNMNCRAACAHRGRRRQGRVARDDRRGGRARRVRRADDVRRRHDVLRPGSAGLRARGAELALR